jgi:hypothetical protein
MLEGFIIGMLIWAGPAFLAWLFVGPLKLSRHFRQH